MITILDGGIFYMVAEYNPKYGFMDYITDEFSDKKEALKIKKEMQDDEKMINGKNTYHIFEFNITKKEIV